MPDEYKPFSLEAPNASLTEIVAKIQQYLYDHWPENPNDPQDPDGYNPTSLQLPYQSLPYIVAYIQQFLSNNNVDGTEYNPTSLQYPQASIPAIVADMQKYLATHPIITADEAGQFIIDYITDHPDQFPVTSVNTMTGNVTLTAGDVGAAPSTREINGHALTADITLDASDVGAVPDTRKVNNKALSADITLDASDVGSVPDTRTVNGVQLDEDITLTPGDLGAVPEDREINGIPLSADVTLTPGLIGAVPVTRTINGQALDHDLTIAAGVPPTRTVNGHPLSSDVTLTASDVGAVPVTRTVNNKQLDENITLSGSDIPAGIMTVGNTVNQDLTELNTKTGDIKADIAFVENTDIATHAIEKLQFVIWKNNLYTAKSNISIGTTLSSSNLQSVSDGGLNYIRDALEATTLIPSNYATMNAGYTGATIYVTRYTPSLAKIHIDLNKSMSKGEVTIGSSTTRVKGTGYLAGRATTANGVLPATAVVTGNGGAIRLYLPDASTACVVNGFIAIEEEI